MTKMAKCGIYKYSFCTHKYDAPECEKCVLINRHGKVYKFINGQKYKKCPHCNEYKPLSEFKPNSQGHVSWCNSCKREYCRNRARGDIKSFMVSHRVEEKKIHINIKSITELIKFVRKCINNNERLIEIKRI